MPARPKLADPGTLIRDGKLRTGTYQACMDPDLIGEYEQLLEQRRTAKDGARDSLAAGGGVPELDEQLAALLEQMKASTVTLTFRAVARPAFRALMDRHPPRKDADGKLTHPQDVLGAAYEPFFDELLRMSLIDPQLDPETLDLLLDERLTDKQWQDLTDVVWDLNRTTVSVPFSPAVSPKTQRSSRR